MKKLALFVLLSSLVTFNSLAQEQRIAYQSFEGSDAENLAYTLNPASYEATGDIWASVQALDAISPSDGSFFWGMQDLENDNGGGAMEHTVTTSVLNISTYTSVRLSADYNVIGFDSDNGDTLAIKVLDGAGTLLHFESIISPSSGTNIGTDGWTTFEYTVDDAVTAVSLQLVARQNGGSDYAGFDNLQFFGVASDSSSADSVIGSVALSVSSRYAYEGDSDLGSITVTATSDSVLNYPASVDVAISSALASTDDYQLSAQTIVIPAYSATGSVQLSVVDDDEAEAPEALTLTLVNRSDNLLAGTDTTAEVVLYSNDVLAPASPIHGELAGTALITQLQADYTVVTPQSYDAIQEEMYKLDGIDNEAGFIEGVYSGFSIEHSSLTGFDATDFATEHIWPTSFYSTTHAVYADAHQLFPARAAIINSKSDLSYAEIPDLDTELWFVDEFSFNGISFYPLNFLIDYSEQTATQFEPRDQYKGDVARAAFYLYAMYSSDQTFNTGETADFFEEVKDVLRTWNQNDPVDSTELARSANIAAIQGNENPFVLDPTLVERAFFTLDDGGPTPDDLAFYTIGGTATGETLVDYLSANFAVTNARGYNGIRDAMYANNGIDNTEGVVEGIYTGFTISGVSSRGDAFDKNINTEHSWPQGKFDSSEPMRGDGHHLFPSLVDANSARGNNPFAEIPDNQTDKWWIDSGSSSSIPSTDVIDQYSESTSSAFEPRESVKGNIARAIFYMWAIYGDRSDFADDASFFEGMKSTLYQWHYQDPADQTEWTRSLAIEEVQGNINPFVHDSSLVRRSYFSTSGGNPIDTTDTTGQGGDDLHYLLHKTFDTDTEVTDGGWTEVSLLGENTWTIKSFGSDTYGEITAYNGEGAEEVKNWFISPAINFDSLEAEILTFKSLTAYNTIDMKLRVLWISGSIDTENLNTAEWNELNPILDPFRGEGYGNFTESGDLDLSAISGTGYIAFYYHNTDGSTTTWQLDDIAVTGTPVQTAIEEELIEENPETITLHQNFPNPFNPTTTISFSLPQAQNAVLQIFDVNGRLVQTLVNGYVSQGEHQISFDASQLSSGLYLYRLVTAEATVTSKMTLLK